MFITTNRLVILIFGCQKSRIIYHFGCRKSRCFGHIILSKIDLPTKEKTLSHPVCNIQLPSPPPKPRLGSSITMSLALLLQLTPARTTNRTSSYHQQFTAHQAIVASKRCSFLKVFKA